MPVSTCLGCNGKKHGKGCWQIHPSYKKSLAPPELESNFYNELPSVSVPCLIGGCNKSVAVELELFSLDTSKYCSTQWVNGLLQWHIATSWFLNTFILKNRVTGHFKSSARQDFFTHALKMGINVQIYTIVLPLPSILSNENRHGNQVKYASAD